MSDDEDEASVEGPLRSPAKIRQWLGMMTPTELSQALGVHVGTLKQWRYRGVGPDYTVAERRVYYTYSDVEEYLRKNRRPAKEGGAL